MIYHILHYGWHLSPLIGFVIILMVAMIIKGEW